MRTGLLLFTFIASQSVWAGHKVGNGGDHIRATYIRMGDAVVEYLRETQQGAQLLKAHNLNDGDLDATLDIAKVSVTETPLRDNTNSVVDAIGVPGLVTLNQTAWAVHFEKERDVYYLVFHEMLRSAGVNDDNYIISAALNPFPASRKIATSLTPLVPLIPEDLLAGVFDLKNVAVGGTGCPRSMNDTRVEFDQERNILDIRPRQYLNEVSASKRTDVKSCQLAIPVQLPKNKRLVISQIDLLGEIDILDGTVSKISFEAFLAGTTAPKKVRTLAPARPLKGKVLTRRTDVLRSKCGGSDIVRLNTAAQTSGNGRGYESLEIQALSLYLSLEDCR